MLKAEETSSTLEISEKCLISSASEDKLGTHFHYQQTGVDLISKGKVAIALVVNNSDDPENSMVSFQTLLCDDQRFVKVIVALYFSCRVFLIILNTPTHRYFYLILFAVFYSKL